MPNWPTNPQESQEAMQRGTDGVTRLRRVWHGSLASGSAAFKVVEPSSTGLDNKLLPEPELLRLLHCGMETLHATGNLRQDYATCLHVCLQRHGRMLNLTSHWLSLG